MASPLAGKKLRVCDCLGALLHLVEEYQRATGNQLAVRVRRQATKDVLFIRHITEDGHSGRLFDEVYLHQRLIMPFRKRFNDESLSDLPCTSQKKGLPIGNLVKGLQFSPYLPSKHSFSPLNESIIPVTWQFRNLKMPISRQLRNHETAPFWQFRNQLFRRALDPLLAKREPARGHRAEAGHATCDVRHAGATSRLFDLRPSNVGSKVARACRMSHVACPKSPFPRR